MKILKKIKRIKEEIKATFFIAKNTSLYEAFNTFIAKLDIQIMCRNGLKEPKRVKKHLLQKHETMIKYFDVEFKDFLKEYNYNHVLNQQDKNYENVIWICWWQGIENAPEIVQSCVNSIKKNTNKEVIIITDKNYRQYVHFPDWVEEKRLKGIMSLTHLSDLLRVSLLAEHGGMWLDATFFCANNNLDKYFNLPLWSIKRPDYLHASVASGYFANYSLRCAFEKRWIFITIRDFFLHYWETNNFLIDYLTLDYMIVLAQKHDSKIKEEFEKIVPNNPLCDELCKLLNKEFDINVWNNLKKDTTLFKLSRKAKIKNSEKETFYSYLIK